MPTPTFKLLLNALRLGQPQDPQAALVALVEALSAQEDTIDELRRKLQVVQSATQILEHKAARLETDLDAMRSHGGADGQYGAPVVPQSSRQPSQRPPPMAAAPAPGQLQSPHSSRHHEQLLQAEGYAPSQQMQQRSLNETQEAPAAPLQPQQPQQQPRSASARPPPPRIPSDRPPAVQQASTAQASAAVFPRAAAVPREPLISEESSHDDFRVETMVVHKKDLEFLKNPDAPFRLPPPGQRAVPDRGSIPGAPWARGAARAADRLPERAMPEPGSPPLIDEFTAEAAPQHHFRDEGDDETYRDGGGIASLAAALGLAADDPRVQKLRSSRPEPAQQDARPTDSLNDRPPVDSVNNRPRHDSVPPPKR